MPIDTLPLFPLLNSQLISFLKDLSAADWKKQTVARQWVVKDVASHLLDGNFRKISLHRDGFAEPPDMAIHSYSDLVNYLNKINGDWVQATKRVSPQILIELLESTNETVYSIFRSLDPFAPSIYPVSWAGEELSYNWFDIAREYTERWLHQQQIRDALGDVSIMTDELYYPLLHIFMQAWPYTLRDSDAIEGSVLKTTITGTGGGVWYLVSENNEWKLRTTAAGNIIAQTTIDGAVAWKLFSKSVRKEDIKEHIEIKGDHVLGGKIADMVSVMA